MPIYEHYKGNRYQIIGEGTHTETGDTFVVYRAIEEGSPIWIRPSSMFYSTVKVDDQEVPRFKLVLL